MAPKIIISASEVTRTVDVGGGVEHAEGRDQVDFLRSLSKHMPFDTGLMPTSVISYRQAGAHAQVVLQLPPGANLVNWGVYEGDRNAKTYTLAQPYQVIIGDFRNGDLLGARLFYSTKPITTLDQVLLAVNLPNINLKGYSHGVGVGWQCLYHKESWAKLTLAEKVLRLGERASGVETYNDRNMSETDGPRFYQQIYAARYPSNSSRFNYLWSPTVWQTKTEQEGYEWVLDDSLWVPICVAGIDDQKRHVANGTPFTLYMAMYGAYKAYYSDEGVPKAFNAFARQDLTPEVWNSIWLPAFMGAAKPGQAKHVEVSRNPMAAANAVAPKGVGFAALPGAAGLVVADIGIAFDDDDDDDEEEEYTYCAYCDDEISPENIELGGFVNGWGWCCASCKGDLVACVTCKQFKSVTNAEIYIVNNTAICTSCKTYILCGACKKAFESGDSNYVADISRCVACAKTEKTPPIGSCSWCGVLTATGQKLAKARKWQTDRAKTLLVCPACAPTLEYCGVCKAIVALGNLHATNEGHLLCVACAQVCHSCARPVHPELISIVDEVTLCCGCSDYHATMAGIASEAVAGGGEEVGMKVQEHVA